MKAHCERAIGFRPRADGYGSEPIHCKRQVALVTWRDSHGTEHHACHDHRETLQYRYPVTEWAPGALVEAFGR